MGTPPNWTVEKDPVLRWKPGHVWSQFGYGSSHLAVLVAFDPWLLAPAMGQNLHQQNWVTIPLRYVAVCSLGIVRRVQCFDTYPDFPSCQYTICWPMRKLLGQFGMRQKSILGSSLKLGLMDHGGDPHFPSILGPLRAASQAEWLSSPAKFNAQIMPKKSFTRQVAAKRGQNWGKTGHHPLLNDQSSSGGMFYIILTMIRLDPCPHS